MRFQAYFPRNIANQTGKALHLYSAFRGYVLNFIRLNERRAVSSNVCFWRAITRILRYFESEEFAPLLEPVTRMRLGCDRHWMSAAFGAITHSRVFFLEGRR